MKYCLDYKRGLQYLNEIDELNVVLDPKNLKAMSDFLEEHADKRINIDIQLEDFTEDSSCMKFFTELLKKNPDSNFALRCPNFLPETDGDLVKTFTDMLQRSGVHFNYFFKKIVANWDTLYGILQYKPCDVYIAEELGFELNAVSAVCRTHEAGIRVFPNVAQSSWSGPSAQEEIKKFFIRPENISIYEPYIDVCEFITPKNNAETYYRIYAKNKKWAGSLNELILSLKLDIQNDFIMDSFATYRVNCGKKCLKGRACNSCTSIVELAEMLKTKKIRLVEEKK